jgi:cytoskeletal protein RodZ
MTRAEPRVRRGAHRPRRDVTRALLPSLLAILAVTALITALYVWRGEDTKPPSSAAATSSATTTATPDPGASASASATPTSPPAASASATSAPATKAGETPQTPAIAVVVLNQTTQGGLANVVADRLRARGWTVAGVGNFRGAVPATTVYYPEGAQAQAEAAASSLPTPARTRPRFGNLSTTRLTVVVTDSYPT